MLKIGVIRTSFKENERRIPIHPEHLPWVPAELRRCLFFETSYGADYGITDQSIAAQSGGMHDRADLFRECDVLMLPKPLPQDLLQMRSGQTLFGWIHCVQQTSMAQAAIDRRLTMIAWEAMNCWSDHGEKVMHIFYKNNEIAGYAAVIQCLQILGIDGHYGPRRKVVILGYGSVSRGAIYALQGRGFNNIHVFTKRPPHIVGDQNPDVYHGQFIVQPNGEVDVIDSTGVRRSLLEELSDADVICNGVLQNPLDPVMFVKTEQVGRLKPRSLIIDISCDEGMGFSFARPTTFEQPTFTLGNNITYYSVDHTPSYLWNAASREVSKAVLPFLSTVIAGPTAWHGNETIRRAIEIEDGFIRNPSILSFQKRKPEYPHEKIHNS